MIRAALLVDGKSLYTAAANAQFSIDYAKMVRHIEGRSGGRRSLIRRNYYAMVPDVGADGFSSIRRLLDWLVYNGWSVIEKPTGSIETETGSRSTGDLRCELTIDAIDISERVDEVYLAGSSGSYQPLVKRLQQFGIRVYVIAAKAYCADGLRRQADEFVDIESLRAFIADNKPPLMAVAR